MEYSSGKQTWNWVYIEDLVSGTSLHHRELELSVYCTRSKDITSHIQNITCQLQPYDLKVSPCIYATILDHNQSLLNHTFTSFQIQLLFSCSVVSNSLRPHGLQHTRLTCTSLSPGVCSNSYPLNW